MPRIIGIVLFLTIAFQALRLISSDSLGMVICGTLLLVLLPTFLILIDTEQPK